MRTTAWVVLDDHGGDLDVTALPSPDVVLAADSGLHVARRLGLAVDVLVGDLDSVDAAARTDAQAAGVAVEGHPADKDATDLALALRAAVGRTAPDDEVVVVGGSGGRLDHALANVVALVDPVLAGRTVRARLGASDLHVVRGTRHFRWHPGATVSLLGLTGTARGVTTTGLRWPLEDEDLPAGTSRGVSNVVDAAAQSITVRDGCLVAVLPHDDGDS